MITIQFPILIFDNQIDILQYSVQAWIDFTNSASPGDQHSEGGATEHRMASVFGRLNYNYDERYMLELTLRRDGSSNFGRNNQYAYFPSVSAGWTLTNEPFMENKPGWFDFLKVRGSWGQNGNEKIGSFGYTTTMTGGNNYSFGASSNGVIHSGTKPTSLANPDLRWETSEQLDFGFDSRFFNNSLSFSFDWFKKDTKDMLMERPIPLYVGSGSPLSNVGTLTNQGIELEVGYKLSVDKVNLSFLANASYVKNEIKNLGNQTGYIDKESLPTLGTVSRNENGYPIGYFFGYKAIGVFQTQEEIDSYISPATGKPIQPNAAPGDTKFEDLNGDGVISDDNEDRTMIGKPNPDWMVGLTVAADWNGFDLSAFFQGSFGADVFDALRRYELAAVNYTSDALERWTGPGTSNSMPRIVLGDTPKNFRPSTLLVHDASFLRLRNLQVGYTLPAQLTRKAYIQRLRFYASFDNLLTITGYKGMDPEIGSTMGIDKGVYPQARVYTFGLNLTF
ncbi:SusC/RagA family TonB-linked outer membrane protein [Parabacteroides distasonis]|uniref:SusC/RagA family TonB-linked outer membrane protein n=1 Tax=Parabacteroides distasonis TaxID=823 RepID=UPI002FDB275B